MARFQEHRDKHVQERWRLGGGCRPIDNPLVKNANDEVAKYGLQEYHLRDEVGVDVEGTIKLDVVGKLHAKSKRHLNVRHII